MNTIFLDNGWYVPIPEGYTLERAIQIVRDYTDHTPVLVKDADGNETPVEEIEEAA